MGTSGLIEQDGDRGWRLRDGVLWMIDRSNDQEIRLRLDHPSFETLQGLAVLEIHAIPQQHGVVALLDWLRNPTKSTTSSDDAVHWTERSDADVVIVDQVVGMDKGEWALRRDSPLRSSR